jgi:hypothetical protein
MYVPLSVFCIWFVCKCVLTAATECQPHCGYIYIYIYNIICVGRVKLWIYAFVRDINVQIYHNAQFEIEVEGVHSVMCNTNMVLSPSNTTCIIY